MPDRMLDTMSNVRHSSNAHSMSDGMPNNMPGRMPEKMMSEKNMGIYVRQNIRRMSHGMPGHIKIECQYIDIR